MNIKEKNGMMSHIQNDKFRGTALAETEILLPPASREDKVLSRLNKDYRLSKAQQILRLLKDQDHLNQRFRDCALLDDDDEQEAARRAAEDDCDTWSVHEGPRSNDGDDDSDDSGNEAERRAARRVALRKHRNSVDPGRCKTSMGFYNAAEVTEIPYDTDSDNVAGLDSACSTPRGVTASGALSARQPAPINHVYGSMGTGAGRPSPAMGISGLMGAGGGGGGGVSSGGNNARLRAYQLNNMGEGEGEGEEVMVQSARSSRPKTSLTPSAARSRYYRQQPHPELKTKKSGSSSSHHNNHSSHGLQNHSLSQGYNHHNNHNNHHHHHNQQLSNQQQQHQQVPRGGGGGGGGGGVGDTRQAIISRLDPYHPMAVRPFCETSDDLVSPRGGGGGGGGVGAQSSCSGSLPSTPRGGGGGGDPSTPRGGSRSGIPYYLNQEVTLFDMAQGFSMEPQPRPASSRHGGPVGGAGGGGGIARSPSFAEHSRGGLPANRALLSVDSNPLQVGDISSPRGGRNNAAPAGLEDGRRPRATRVKKRVGEMPRGAVQTSMHLLAAERGHPALTVMKLPPLETSSVNKGGPNSSRDLVCVGKD